MGRLKFHFQASPRGDAYHGPYQTSLHPVLESHFRKWLAENKDMAPGVAEFNPDDQNSDYDMRGWWQAFTDENSPHHEFANLGTSSFDSKPHFNDYWKTPYHESFSQESKFAVPGMAREWMDDGAGGWNLVNRRGEIEKMEPNTMGAE